MPVHSKDVPRILHIAFKTPWEFWKGTMGRIEVDVDTRINLVVGRKITPGENCDPV